VESQADASEQILKELQRVIASQERMRIEVTAEVQQVCAEVKEWHAEMEKWHTEMEKTVRTVELNEAQLRTQILGTAEGLV
jgi:septal ring factor EnvC (AmiA/AmiB activator)